MKFYTKTFTLPECVLCGNTDEQMILLESSTTRGICIGCAEGIAAELRRLHEP